MKFSIIIPVYNAEKYLKRCIESVLNQSYKSYEIIIINDGSTDNSKILLESYKAQDKITVIEESNHGVSYARNLGLNYANGEYILFLDSDDYYDEELLSILNKNITNEEMIKFNYYDLKNNQKTPAQTIEFRNEKGCNIFKQLVEKKIMIETPWTFAIKKEYMIKYKFTPNKYHEDFGLMPIMVYNSKNISSINYLGYIYNRENEISITSFTDMNKEYKKAIDTLYFFKQVKNSESDKYILSFYANGALYRIKNLKSKEKQKFLKELKKEKVYNYILDNNYKRKIKKLLLKLYFIFK